METLGGEIARGEAKQGQAVIVIEGIVPSDDDHRRANCEAVHKLASSIGDPIGIARGSGVVFVPQAEADYLQTMEAKMRGCSEIMSPAMRSKWSEAMDARRPEAGTEQIDESRDVDTQDLPDIHWHLGAPECL